MEKRRWGILTVIQSTEKRGRIWHGQPSNFAGEWAKKGEGVEIFTKMWYNKLTEK